MKKLILWEIIMSAVTICLFLMFTDILVMALTSDTIWYICASIIAFVALIMVLIVFGYEIFTATTVSVITSGVILSMSTITGTITELIVHLTAITILTIVVIALTNDVANKLRLPKMKTFLSVIAQVSVIATAITLILN